MDIEGSVVELGECPRLGYYRVCGETLVPDEPYEALGHYLRLLSKCMRKGGCKNAVPASGRFGVARRLDLRTLQRMVNMHFVDAGLGASITTPLSLSLTQPYENPAFRLGYHKGLFDIVAHSSGITLALRGGADAKRIYLPRYEEKRERTPLALALRYLPLAYIVSFEILTAYYQTLRACEVSLPPTHGLCSKGFRVQCYFYKGGSDCIYTHPGSVARECALRYITRRGLKTLGGAFHWLKRAQDKVNEARGHLPSTPQSSMDFSITCFLINHLSREALDAAVANARILGESSKPIMDYYAELGLGECKAPPPENTRLREHLRKVAEEREERSLSIPNTLRTEVLISLEKLPTLLNAIAEKIEVTSVYKNCRPTTLRPSQRESLKAYIRTQYPILGSVVNELVEAISKTLEEHGCVEPDDLNKHVGQSMALQVLDYLSQRNILLKMRVGSHTVYKPTTFIRELL